MPDGPYGEKYEAYECRCGHCGCRFEVNYQTHTAGGYPVPGTYDMEKARLRSATDLCDACKTKRFEERQEIERLREKERNASYPKMPD
jgi:hypothetical protein